MRRVFAFATLLGILTGTGCGYHVAGTADLLPKTIKTIAIPAFANTTSRPQLARLLPEDIGREFISRTHYVIVADPNQADAVLTGGVTNVVAVPTTFDPVTGRATGIQAVVTLQLTLRNRATNEVLWQRQGATFKQQYEIAIDPTKYFDESGPAMIRLSKDVAQGVVTAILENF